MSNIIYTNLSVSTVEVDLDNLLQCCLCSLSDKVSMTHLHPCCQMQVMSGHITVVLFGLFHDQSPLVHGANRVLAFSAKVIGLYHVPR